MDPATLIGIGAMFGIIFLSVTLEGGNPSALFFLPPMLLVLGGSIAVAIAGNTMGDLGGVGKALVKACAGKPPKAAPTVETIVSLADKARREGLLALEEAVQGIDDPFLNDALQLAIDGTDPEDLQEVLFGRIEAKRTDDKVFAKFFNDMGAYAPTIGIIGTTFGLVHALENLDEPEKLGHIIAGAFIATLWGVMSANVMWLPIGARLKRLSDLECTAMEIVVEGVLAIQAGGNPRSVARKLQSLLPPAAAAKEAKSKAA